MYHRQTFLSDLPALPSLPSLPSSVTPPPPSPVSALDVFDSRIRRKETINWLASQSGLFGRRGLSLIQVLIFMSFHLDDEKKNATGNAGLLERITYRGKEEEV